MCLCIVRLYEFLHEVFIAAKNVVRYVNKNKAWSEHVLRSTLEHTLRKSMPEIRVPLMSAYTIGIILILIGQP